MSSNRTEEPPTFRLLGIEVGDGIAVVTLDDPARRNALSFDMSDELVRAFDEHLARNHLELACDVGA